MKRLVVAAVVVMLIASCSATTKKSTAARLHVHTQFEETTDFQQWKTFRMATVQPSDTDYTRYPRFERMVRESLVANLTDRGYQRADDGSTDFRVAFELIFRGAKAPDGFESTHGVSTEPGISRGTRTVSTLVVKMLDPVTGEVQWEGRLSGFEVDSVTPESSFEKAVWRMLVEFPPITS